MGNCKYTYKGTTYNSKEEFVDNIIKPQFLFNNSKEIIELNNQLQDLKKSLSNFEAEFKKTNNLELKRQIDNFSKLILEGKSQLNTLKSFSKKQSTKTRRILEVQSDLFQKGRDKEFLSNNLNRDSDFQIEVNSVKYAIADGKLYSTPTYDYNLQEVSDINKVPKNVQEWFSSRRLNNNKNQFLQLLNKDNNWVTFFVKSIIQDSAKKGYEKVLFPLGDTASKIEGHSTLEEFKKQKEERIKELEEKKKTASNNKPWLVSEITGNKKHYFNTEEEANEFRRTNGRENFYSAAPTSSLKDSLKNIEDINKEIEQLKQELKRVEIEGFGALRPIYNFYENTVANILKKQGYNPIEITDEYGNKWNEVTLNQARDLANILLQRNEANQIIGQANIKAMTVLIDAVNQRSDTIPHEYAHHYIAWFRNTPIVQEAIKKWGSEEALVQAVGEQVVKQKGEAYNWWKKFTNWLLNLLSDKQLLQILTDSFLNRQDLNDFTYNNVGTEQLKKFTELQERLNNKEFLEDAKNAKESQLGQETNKQIQELIQSGEIYYTDDEGKPCAAKGLRNTTTGTNWKIVEDLKGPSHEIGGINLSIGSNGVSFKRNNSDIVAAHGLVIQYIK